MIQENELIVFILAAGLWVFLASNWSSTKKLPDWKLFILACSLFTVGWALTLLEGFFWHGILNSMEHAAYAASSILFSIWCWRVFGSRYRKLK